MTALAVRVAGLTFQNPVLLASGTAGYGRELCEVTDLEALGGLVTKAVSVEPRAGNPRMRVADFDGGMINAVGLANPGADVVAAEQLPWLAAHVQRARVLVNVVGKVVDDFAQVVRRLDASAGHQGYELNVSCPNTKAGGLEFGADPEALTAVVSQCRAATRKPLFVKLSPTLHAGVGAMARRAVDAGADGVSVVNTIPGLVFDLASRRPALGFGTGGVSGPGLLPVGVLAVRRVREACPETPVIGVGGVLRAEDAVQYLLAGASLVAMGTATMADPRQPERVVRGLARWCAREGVRDVTQLVGAGRLS